MIWREKNWSDCFELEEWLITQSKLVFYSHWSWCTNFIPRFRYNYHNNHIFYHFYMVMYYACSYKQLTSKTCIKIVNNLTNN